MKAIKFLSVMLCLVAGMSFVSCGDDDEPENKDHDATLYGEWVSTSGRYVHDYYCFDSDGTGIHGSYESDIDWVNEDDDITWYTVDDEVLYIDGKPHSYDCDGSSLCIDNECYNEL